jgi:hypothetical protein
LFAYSPSQEKLLKLLRKSQGKKTIVFCNSPKTCDLVFAQLQKRGYSVVKMDRKLSPKVQHPVYKFWTLSGTICQLWKFSAKQQPYSCGHWHRKQRVGFW